MENLALNKLPLEKDSWKRPEEATNGNVSKYDGHNGFSLSYYPCNFTIDLEREHRLTCVRFLLWDNYGRPGSKINAREYTFSLSVSSDGNNFITVFSNQNQKGGNGWYSFRFLNDTYVRFVRLTGLSNTANKEFHIVEFEIYEEEPLPLSSSNIHSIDIAIGLGIPSKKLMEELVEKAILNKSKLFEGLENKINQLDKNLIKSGESIDLIEIIKKSKEYRDEAGDNNDRARKWLISAGVTLGIFLVLLIWLVFCDNHAKEIIKDAANIKSVSPFTTFLLMAFYTAKAVLLSTLLFMLGWFLKNYRSEKHNYTINQHKAMTLTVATAILTREEYKNTDRGNIFTQAMEIIFSHQASGFSKDDGTSPSVINTLLQKSIPKADI
jgi:hypothetical protein